VKQHNYEIQVEWTGNQGQGTKTYRGYSKDHSISANGKPVISGSSDPSFRGDPLRYNPEELLVASLSACHMLWYLHLCAAGGIVVIDYKDNASGLMVEDANGSGAFTEVTLHPEVKISADGDEHKALSLHWEAHHLCFIANSVNFPVKSVPHITKEA
jgi:organic hydroperoxide reductase OsmC/OhrA